MKIERDERLGDIVVVDYAKLKMAGKDRQVLESELDKVGYAD